jgi:hypothetical protein
MKLPEIRPTLYKAFAAGQISEAEAEELDTLINTKAAIPAPEKPVQRRVGSRPRSSALAEQAVLAVVAVEVSKRGCCGLTVAHLAALAGCSESTVRNALRECEALGLVSIDRRRRSPWINYPNEIQILSKEWLLWLRLRTGAKAYSPRIQESKKGRESGIPPAAFVPKSRSQSTWETPERGFRQSRGG